VLDNSNRVEEVWRKREIVEDFVRTRTDQVSNSVFPWLEARLNPPPMDILPCHTMPLPKDYIPNSWEASADHALVPHIPPVDYLLHPPDNLWAELRNDDLEWSEIILDGVEDVIYDELRRVYGDNPTIRPLLADREKLLRLYWTLAVDTRIEGVDRINSYSMQQTMQQCVEVGGRGILSFLM
jgi:hypothetical protein